MNVMYEANLEKLCSDLYLSDSVCLFLSVCLSASGSGSGPILIPKSVIIDLVEWNFMKMCSPQIFSG